MADAPDLKWAVGIVIGLLAAGGGVAAWIGMFKPHPPPPTYQAPSTSNQPPVESPKPIVCSVSGRVLDSDTHQPIAAVEVGYLRLTQDPNDWIHGVKSRLATSGPDGGFTCDCTAVEKDNFPLRILLKKNDWGKLTYQTDEYVQYGQDRKDVNIYLSENRIKSLPVH
jgi:hypothetical protein